MVDDVAALQKNRTLATLPSALKRRLYQMNFCQLVYGMTLGGDIRAQGLSRRNSLRFRDLRYRKLAITRIRAEIMRLEITIPWLTPMGSAPACCDAIARSMEVSKIENFMMLIRESNSKWKEIKGKGRGAGLGTARIPRLPLPLNIILLS
jgi:hypothetical protein